MPIKNENIGQLFYEVDGETIPINGIVSIDECGKIVSSVENALNNPEYFKVREITFKMPRKEYKRWKKIFQNVMPRYFTNNWRKMHHLPIIRRKGKRK